MASLTCCNFSSVGSDPLHPPTPPLLLYEKAEGPQVEEKTKKIGSGFSLLVGQLPFDADVNEITAHFKKSGVNIDVSGSRSFF